MAASNQVPSGPGKWPFPIKLRCQESVLHGRYDSWYDLIGPSNLIESSNAPVFRLPYVFALVF